jgi:ribosomal protein S13
MEEEALIFDSDVDAEARNLENKFAEALKLLGGYVKSKIKGKGMEVLRTVMEKAEHSSAPRLTNFNHEEDQKLREQVFATIQEDVRRAFEEAKRLAEEEAEAARIASEERARKQAALNVTVDMLVRMAEVETQKLMDAQVMGPNPDRDIVMTEQVTPEKV